MHSARAFRKYDIRGIIDQELFIDDVSTITRAITYYCKQQVPTLQTIAVGMDGRIHSAAIKEQVCNALLNSGIDVIFLGMCTTPAMYFACNTFNVQAGIMITASHNPKEYNGLKILLNKESVWDEQLQEVKQLSSANIGIQTSAHGNYSEHLIIPQYTTWLVKHFAHLKNLQVSVIIDCGNGVAGMVIPELIKQLNWQHAQALFTEVDGTFPNHEPDPTSAVNMQQLKEVVSENPDTIGIGLDGDADRVAAMTAQGRLVPGDKLLAIFAQSLHADAKGKTIVFDVTCTKDLYDLLRYWDFNPQLTPTGFAYIKEALKKHNGILGGEISGHYCFNDRYFGYDDGIYAMLRLFELLVQTKKTLTELAALLPEKISSPVLRIVCPEEQKNNIIEHAYQQLKHLHNTEVIAIDGVRLHTKHGWGIVRASNTQPMLSIRIEADTTEQLTELKEHFFNALEPFFDPVFLKKELQL